MLVVVIKVEMTLISSNSRTEGSNPLQNWDGSKRQNNEHFVTVIEHPHRRKSFHMPDMDINIVICLHLLYVSDVSDVSVLLWFIRKWRTPWTHLHVIISRRLLTALRRYSCSKCVKNYSQIVSLLIWVNKKKSSI